VEIFVKDLGIVQDMARTARFPVPVAAAALQMFLMTAASGMGRDDDASVARLYARVTGTALPGDPKLGSLEPGSLEPGDSKPGDLKAQ
jgi:3-hydroxyisobutyrate dehydrogenase